MSQFSTSINFGKEMDRGRDAEKNEREAESGDGGGGYVKVYQNYKRF